MTAPTLLRPDEEVAGGYISVTLGGQARSLPVLPVVRNREWKQKFDTTVTGIGAGAENDDFEAVVQLLSGSIEKMLDLLVQYDEGAALGGREWLETHATDREVYEAFKKVTDAAFPFGVDLMTRLLGEIRLNMVRLAGSKSMSSVPPNTGGRRGRSKAA